MSLLLDALKRAEQEKLTRQGDRPAPAPGPRAAGSTADAANSALELAPLPPPASSASRAGDVAAAQAVFKAKAPQESQRNRGALWAAAAAVVVLLVSAGAYVWYSVRGLAPARLAAPARVRPQPLTPPPAILTAPRPEQFSPSPPPAPGGAAPAPAAPTPGEAPAAAPAKAASPAPRPSAADQILKSSAPGDTGPVKLARSREEKPRVPADVVSGYEALVAGDLGAASRLYAAAIQADPANVDAQLGLATVEARRGNAAASAAAYRRALALDPQNPTALAGLAALADFSRPEALESDLRADLAREPRSAALNLTLGNLYAAQGRWAEAQAAYFEAHRLQPENPDVAYDLAVSLDHLGQRRPAADFYRRALEARRGVAAQFDAAAAARRLSELTR
ncbi:MAG TPA: tetratricopeptide repeat protein [Usitatibacter sp.]|nr:tetratricopeptide repeat protein [Usitatibacter sp.]